MRPQISSPVVVGRADELAVIERLISATAAGTSGLLVLSGEAGIGKTRLVARATELARDHDLQVMAGHCVQLGTEGVPYAPVVEALRELTRTAGDDLEAVLGPARDLVLRLTTGTEGALGQESLAGSQILELVLGVIERVASLRPLLLVLEDLHWSDRSTLELAAFLAQNLRGVPVLLVFTYRSDEVDRRHPLRQLQATWERARVGTRLELGRFDRSAVRDMLTGILGAEPDAETLALVYDRSEGNAFLAEEMLSAVTSGDPRGLPSSLRDLLLARLDQLSPATEEVLRLAAIAGRSVPERLLVAASGLPELEVLAAIREAVDAHLLVVNQADHGYRFRHALTRDAVYDDLLPGERVRLHGQYADALAGDPSLVADTALSTAAELAHHAYASLDLPRALAASVTAGAEAVAQFAPHEALAHYERALLLWPRVPAEQLPNEPDQVEVTRLAGLAAYDAGELERSLALFAQALTLQPPDDAVRRARITREYARSMRDLGRNREARELLEAALPLLPEGPSEVGAALEADLATLLMRQFDAAAIGHHAARAVDAARAVGSARIEADALVTLGCTRALVGDPETVPMVQAGLERAATVGDSYILLRAYVNLTDVLELWGRSREAVTVAEAGLVAAEESGMVRTVGTYLLGNLAESLIHVGEWRRAAGLLDEALHRLPAGVFGTTAHAFRAELAVLTGDRAAVVEATRRTRSGLPDDVQFELPLIYLEAELARAERDHSRVLELVRDVVRRPVGPDEAQLLRYMWPVVWVAVRSESERRAVDGVPLDAAVATFAAGLGAPTPPTAGWQALTRAEAAGTGPDGDPDLWAAAAEIWRRIEWPWHLAHAQLRRAETLVERGERERAEAPLREALALADRLGAAPLLDEARLLARRARIDLDEPAGESAAAADDPLARYGLTSREREVLLLLAEGESNPGIAGRLFISPKTASVHVSNILGKLGVEGRVQAAGLVHRLGLGPEPR